MARYTGPKCKLCRAEGTKLFIKGDRCYTSKCAIEKRNKKPGQHGMKRGRRRLSSYGEQLSKQTGVTGTNLLRLLELRLDNIVYRLGFAPNRNTARQLVRHSHITLNGRRLNIPSAQVKLNDVISVKALDKKLKIIVESIESKSKEKVEEWLDINEEKYEGKVIAIPNREQIPININELLIVEFYSR